MTLTLVLAAFNYFLIPFRVEIDTTDWQKYTNLEYGYTIKVPQNWVIINGDSSFAVSDKTEATAENVMFTPLKSDNLGVILNVDDNPEVTSLNEYFSWETFPSAQNVSHEDSSLTSASQVDMRYLVTPSASQHINNGLNRFNFYAARDGRIFYLGFSDYSQTSKAILNSFQFIGAENPNFKLWEWTYNPYDGSAYALQQVGSKKTPCGRYGSQVCNLVRWNKGELTKIVDLIMFKPSEKSTGSFRVVLTKMIAPEELAVAFDSYNEADGYKVLYSYNVLSGSWVEIVRQSLVMAQFNNSYQNIITSIKKGEKELIFSYTSGGSVEFPDMGVYLKIGSKIKQIKNPFRPGDYGILFLPSENVSLGPEVTFHINGGQATFNFETETFLPY